MKIFGYLLGLSVVASPITNIATTVNIPTQDNELVEDEEACTVAYIGKDCTKDHLPIIARSADAGPRLHNNHVKLVEHNELANKVIKGNNGFQYTMPSTTYKYICTPRNTNIHKGYNWQSSGINENGVGVSATLSCGTNPAVADHETGEGVDPFIKTGISEDNLAQIMAATATSARGAMETIASIIDKQGNCDPNAIMAVDQNEAWYMELYSGHQYAAVKLPDDKCGVVGNEFVLDSLADYGKDNYFASDGIIDIAEKAETATWTSSDHIVENLDLFHSYAKELLDTDFSNNSHRRTWRGYSLWAPSSDYAKSYDPTKKYPAWFVPENSGNMTVHDVMVVMRDKFDELLEKEEFKAFKEDYERGVLRFIGVETAYQIHAITSNPNLPKELACTEWLCMSDASYAPFIPLNNAITSMSDYYTHISDAYDLDFKSASCIYKALNGLGQQDRYKWGIPVQNYWIEMEQLIDNLYHQVLNKVKDLSLSKASDILSNFTKYLQEDCIAQANQLNHDLTIHILNDPWLEAAHTQFIPLINIKEYAHWYGWDKFKLNSTSATLSNGTKQCDMSWPSEFIPPFNYATVKIDDEIIEKVKILVLDNTLYMSKATIDHVLDGGDVIDIDINNYKTKTDDISTTTWVIIGVVCGLAAIALIAVLIYFNKNKKVQPLAGSRL